ncbi:DEAD/DEAH box helicase [Pseudomonas sp. IT-196MI5]|uniref:DEAD/DEAH box helicase n=1 Tax=Pseudomonas sp. IT-196MI5 TaxID=3026440 RepID=UPI0039E02AC7
MKLEARSKRLLGLSKSTAKLKELKVSAEMHPPLADDPFALIVLTIGILGQLAALTVKDENFAELTSLKEQLVDVAQYFDSLDGSGLLDESSLYLRMLGAAAYYLADMPGSSSVLAKEIPYEYELSPHRLEGVLIWILKSDYRHVWYRQPGGYFSDGATKLVNSLHAFYEGSSSDIEVNTAAIELREMVYKAGSDRDLLFIDVICAVVRVKIRNSSRICLPLYSELGLDAWRAILARSSFMKEFWPAQRLMGEAGILKGVSAVVQMPTSAGKSRAMELIVRSALLSGRAKLIVLVAPFRALCAEITDSFKGAFASDDVLINDLPDLNQITESDSEFLKFLLGDKYKERSKGSVLVTTPEKLAYLLRHEDELAASIDLLLFDEGHQFDTGKRGVTYELLISYLRDAVSPKAQKVMISAVMANAKSIGDWLNFEAGIEIQGAKVLPTVRAIGFATWSDAPGGGGVQFFDQGMLDSNQYFVPGLLQPIEITESKGKVRRYPDRLNSREVASYLAVKFCELGGAAIFCGTKVIVRSVCKDLVTIFEKGVELPLPVTAGDSEEIGKLHYLASLHMGACEYTKAIKIGVMPHSSNIPAGLRSSVEWALSNGKASLVVCTSTLAQGVNLPIRYLLITSTFQAGNAISTRDFQNLMGRAGRSGYYTEGNVIFTDPQIFDNRRSSAGFKKWLRVKDLLSFDSAEDCLSSLKGLVDKFPSPGSSIDVMEFLSNSPYWLERAVELRAAEKDKYRKRDFDSLIFEMNSRVDRMRALESYIIAYVGDDPDAAVADIQALAKETLAYSLSTEDEQNSLIALFVHIFDKMKTLDARFYKGYGRSLLGIDQLKLVEQWLDDNQFDLGISESCEDALQVVWTLVMQLSQGSIGHKIMPENLSLDIALKWIAGQSYREVLEYVKLSKGHYQAGKQKRTVTIDNIIEFCDKFLGYEAMLYVGGVADILEAKGILENCVTSFRLLQSRLKYGLSSDFEIGLYTGNYPDREVVKMIVAELDKVSFVKLNQESINNNPHLIVSVLARFPSYFSR